MSRKSVASEIAKGETFSWKKTFADYPADDGWAVTYYFRGPSGAGVDAAGTADGKSFEFEVSAAATAGMNVGRYDFQALAVKGAEKRLVDSGQIQVMPGLAGITAATAHDGRTEFEIILEAIDAALKGKATKDQLSYSIGDRELRRYDPTELIELRQTYQKLRNQEILDKRNQKGLGIGKKLYTRFKRPI